MPSAIVEFLRKDRDIVAGGLLMAAALLALLAVNSPLEAAYRGFLETRVAVELGSARLVKPLLLWINDGLMAVFFLLVGLEIKREAVEGHLKDARQLILPGAAALGGMVFPAFVYLAINFGDPRLATGWAIPSATDIAFALGILALFGRRVPVGLKTFLMLAAVFDDIGAIVVIALFYSGELSVAMLAPVGAIALALIALNRLHIHKIWPYALLGVLLWLCVLKSGVHATLAGIVVAIAIPMEKSGASEFAAVGKRIEYELHSLVGFVIVPLFAFANAGVRLIGLEAADLAQSVPLGIALGLFVGKQVGMFAPAYLLIRTGRVRMPEGATWMALYGVCVLAGVGFTMSLFIGALAFDGLETLTPSDLSYAAQLRLGVLTGSLLSAALGAALLFAGTRSLRG